MRVVALAITLAITLASALLLQSSPAAAAFTWHIPVLKYHHTVCPPKGPDLHYLCPIKVRHQLDALTAGGWHSISGAELAQNFAAGVRPKPKSYVISVDGSGVESYTSTLPLLRARHLVGTFFVVTSRIGKRGSMTWAQVAALAKAGMDVENHSATLPHLDTLSYDDQLAEMREASDAITSHTGVAPSVFALPWGAYNADTLQALADSGLTISVSSIEGVAVRSSVPFLIHRITAPFYPKPAALLAAMRAP